jgi:hypothetical protein
MSLVGWMESEQITGMSQPSVLFLGVSCRGLVGVYKLTALQYNTAVSPCKMYASSQAGGSFDFTRSCVIRLSLDYLLVRVGHTRKSRFCTFLSLQPATPLVPPNTNLIFADSYESATLVRVFFFVHSRCPCNLQVQHFCTKKQI